MIDQFTDNARGVGVLAGQPEDQGPDVPARGRLPVLPRMDLAAQRRRTMPRQRTILSRVISSRSPYRRALGITPGMVAANARSAQSKSRRRGCRRCGMANWWRKIKISAVFQVPYAGTAAAMRSAA